MGCCSSVNDVNKPLVSNPSAGQAGNGAATTAGGATPSTQPASPKAGGGTKEDQIKLALKTKRGNVFTESYNPDERRAFSAKVIPKSPVQETIISTSISCMLTTLFYVCAWLQRLRSSKTSCSIP
jgi:hypothetical protein